MSAIQKKTLKNKKFKEVHVLMSPNTVYLNIDTPYLKALLPINENTLKPQNFVKEGFMFIKSDKSFGFFLERSIEKQIQTALKIIKNKNSKGE